MPGGDSEVYIGSSDWMPRNLDRRVEVLTPIENRELKRYLTSEYLNAYLSDNVKARELSSDGSYQKVAVENGTEPFNCQLAFQDLTNIVDFQRQ